MKKFAFLTALLLCLGAFSACGDTDDGENKKSSSKSSPAYEMNDDEDETEKETTEEESTTEVTTTEAPTEAETEPPTEEKEDISYVRGRSENGSYVSDYANFRFDAGSDWTFATEEQMLELMGLASKQTDSKETIDKLIAEQAVIYDAHVLRNDGQKNVIFMFENVRKEGVDPDDLNENSFLELLKLNLNSSQGDNYSNYSSNYSFNVGSDEYKYFTVNTESPANGTIYQTYACKRVDDYYFGIIYTSTQDDFSSFIGSFSNVR